MKKLVKSLTQTESDKLPIKRSIDDIPEQEESKREPKILTNVQRRNKGRGRAGKMSVLSLKNKMKIIEDGDKLK